jgi:hypothetical protein
LGGEAQGLIDDGEEEVHLALADLVQIDQE